MRAWHLLLPAVAWTAIAAGQSPVNQDPGANLNGNISGQVVDSLSHLPMRKATVTLAPVQQMPVPRTANAQVPAAGRSAPSTTMTDAAGNFAFAQLKPGPYRLEVSRPDYPQSRYGAGKTMSVDVTQNSAPVTVELVPPAAISGRILDEDGDPMYGCAVAVHPAAQPEQSVNMPGGHVFGSESEYRLYSIPAGKYVLTAQCGGPVFQQRPFSTGPDPLPSQAYRMQYYPGAPDAASAEVVELTPGTERGGVDFRMKPAAVTQVRVTLAPGSADPHGKNLTMRLIAAGATNMGTPAIREPAGNSFLFRQVFPGAYLLTATVQGASGEPGAIQRIDVKDRPLAVAIELKQVVDIGGTVELEANGGLVNNTAVNAGSSTVGSSTPATGASGDQLRLSQIRLQLTPEYPEFGQMRFGLPQGGDSQVKPDGSFTFRSLLPATWRLRLNGAAVFVRSAWLGNREVTGGLLDLTSGTVNTLRIVVSANTATIQGTAPAGVVTYYDMDEPANLRRTRSVAVDQSGQFHITGVSPGRYRIVAQELNNGLPEEGGGQEVAVREGENLTLALTATAR